MPTMFSPVFMRALCSLARVGGTAAQVLTPHLLLTGPHQVICQEDLTNGLGMPSAEADSV